MTDTSIRPPASRWAAGLTEDERPVTEPLWSVFVDEALSAAPNELVLDPAAAPDPGAGAFGPVLRPFARAAVDRLRAATAHLPGVDLPAVLAEAEAALVAALAEQAARTLVYELHRAKGSLAATTPRARFLEFLRRAGGRDALRGLLATYPVLARIVGQTCLRGVETTAELLTRFAADRAEIAARLLPGADPGPLVSVRAGLGDRHRGGRSVTRLGFADGRAVIHRPRPMELHAHFAELLDWLNARVPDLGLRIPACLTRPGYGWVEFVEHAPCALPEDVDHFYRRQGALLALLYAVDATDIHHENLIAAGDQPVLVDVETLFQPVFQERAATGHDPAAAALAASVGRTVLLPSMVVGEAGALDISGLGGGDGGHYPVEVTRWVEAGTDGMRLERRRARFTGSANRPRLGDRPADPAAHLPALLAGFRAAYTAVAEHRAELVAEVLPRFATDEVRVVARHTQRYAALLADSTHPALLGSAADRDRLFDLLRSTPGPEVLPELPDHEIAELRAGDIPTFRTRPDSRDLWTADGTRLADRLDRTGLEAVAAKLAGMGQRDRGRQEWLIAATFATRGATVDHHPDADRGAAPPAPAGCDPDRVLEIATGIADDIADRAARDGRRANWVGIEALDERFWAVLPMGAGLACGYGGVALFLAQLGELTGAGRYRDLAAEAARPMADLVDRLAADPDAARAAGAGFAGLGGITYALARLSTLLDDSDLRALVDPAVGAMAAAGHDGTTAFHDGAAGGLAALVAAHEETGSAAARSLAPDLADRLTSSPGGGGFLYGPAGVGWALLRCADSGLGGPRHRRAGRAALARAVVDPGNAAWCSGTAGVAAALAYARGRAADDCECAALDGRIAAAAKALAQAPPPADTSLCHGEVGVLHGLAALAAHDEAARCALTRRLARLLDTLATRGPRCGTPWGVPTPGLLAGLAGIGHGLLHLGFPERAPSVLHLAPADPQRRA